MMECPKCNSVSIHTTSDATICENICKKCQHEWFGTGAELPHDHNISKCPCEMCKATRLVMERIPDDPIKIMEGMLETFKERHKIYGDNYKQVGKVMREIFPEGITLKESGDHDRFNLFSMIVVKLTRLANTNIKHKDSVHDIGVYAAMLESLL